MKAAAAPLYSYLRLLHALPTSLSLDVYLDGKKYTKDLLYEDFTLYKPLAPGTHQLTLCAHKSLDALYEREVWIGEHKIYTLVLAYEPSQAEIQSYLLTEPPKAIPEEHLLIRTGNFSQELVPISLHLVDIKPVFKKVPVRQTSSYLAFLPATASIELQEIESQKTLLKATPCTFKMMRYYSLYIIGGTKDYPLKWIRTLDGNSFLHFEA